MQHSATYQDRPQTEPTLQEILVALSFALDLTEDAVPGHAVRCCLLATRIGLAAGLSRADLSDLYFATLLKDVGCSSNAARMCQIVGGDDRILKSRSKYQDWTKPLKVDLSTWRQLWREIVPGASVFGKSSRLLHLAFGPQAYGEELFSLRCDRGAQIIRKLGLSDSIAIAVRHLDEHWDGNGYPQRCKAHDIPVLSRIMCLAQHLDAFCMSNGPQAAIDSMLDRSGRWFDPQLVAATASLHAEGTLWRQCLPTDSVDVARNLVLHLHPADEQSLSALDIDGICEAFADVVDAKSPFTFRHSLGVRDAAAAIGEALGLAPERLQLLRRAALLHDIGKLGISNSILDKPSALTSDEFNLIKAHPTLSASILGRIGTFHEIAVLTAEHHEKLDGTGYPFGLTHHHLSLESRVLAVADIFAALSEHRPYREGLPRKEITAIMDRSIPHKLDLQCYDALLAVMDDLMPQLPPSPSPTLSHLPAPAGAFVEVLI